VKEKEIDEKKIEKIKPNRYMGYDKD